MHPNLNITKEDSVNDTIDNGAGKKSPCSFYFLAT